MQKHQRERLQDQFLQQQLLAQAQHRMSKNVRWPGDQLQVNPVILQSKRRREEAEAQAKKHRAVIAREIQRQKEQLLAPTCAKERLGIWQSVRREKRHKFSPKRSSSITKAHRRKQLHNLSQRARHQRMLEMEAQRDAKFLEQHAKKQRLEGGRVMGQSESPGTKSKGSVKSKASYKNKMRPKGKTILKKGILRESNHSLEKKSREELASKIQQSIHWTAGTISKMEADEHLSWRKERTDQLNNTRLRELVSLKKDIHI